MPNSNYTLTIENKTSETATDNPIAGQTGAGQTAPTAEQSSGGISSAAIVKGLVSFNSFVKPFVQPIVDGYIQTVELRTGSKEAQQRLQFAYGIAQQAVSLVSGVAIGFAVGNIPGAVLGAATSVMSTAINYAKRSYELGLEQTLENITLRGMNVRAGGYAPSYAGSRSGRQ